MAKWWKTKRSTRVVYNPGGESYCQYHDTAIVTWTNKRVTLDLGGCEENDSVTCRRRMNEVADYEGLPYRVFRHKKETVVDIRTGHKCAKRYDTLSFTDYVVSFDIPRMPKGCPDCALALLANV